MIGTGMKDIDSDPRMDGRISPYERRTDARIAEENRRAANPALYKEDDKPQPVLAQPMYQAPAPVNVAPPTLDPISSGQPIRLPQIAEQLAGTQAVPATGMATGFTPSNFAKPQNKAYTFQELLGMYQNPYA